MLQYLKQSRELCWNCKAGRRRGRGQPSFIFTENPHASLGDHRGGNREGWWRGERRMETFYCLPLILITKIIDTRKKSPVINHPEITTFNTWLYALLVLKKTGLGLTSSFSIQPASLSNETQSYAKWEEFNIGPRQTGTWYSGWLHIALTGPDTLWFVGQAIRVVISSLTNHGQKSKWSQMVKLLTQPTLHNCSHHDLGISSTISFPKHRLWCLKMT